MLIALAFSSPLGMATNDTEQTAHPEVAVPKIVPLKLGSKIPLSVQSSGVVWKGYTNHLVRLGWIKFELDKSDRLKADILTQTTTFDNVDYDISGAVFDATGQLLGSARAQCKVYINWSIIPATSTETVTLDFGVSLDYTRAAAFMLSISNRKVLTPDDWPKHDPDR